MDTTKDDVDNQISTGNTIMNQLGFKMTVPALSNWPEDGATKFIVGEELKEIGDQLIDRYRDDLRNHNIAYVFKKKAPKSDTNVTLGQVKTEGDLQKVLHGYDATIIIGHDTWITLEEDAKLRLIYHELEHLMIDFESGKIKTIPHHVEEFPSVMRVFGPASAAQVDYILAYQEFQKNHTRQ